MAQPPGAKLRRRLRVRSLPTATGYRAPARAPRRTAPCRSPAHRRGRRRKACSRHSWRPRPATGRTAGGRGRSAAKEKGAPEPAGDPTRLARLWYPQRRQAQWISSCCRSCRPRKAAHHPFRLRATAGANGEQGRPRPCAARGPSARQAATTRRAGDLHALADHGVRDEQQGPGRRSTAEKHTAISGRTAAPDRFRGAH